MGKYRIADAAESDVTGYAGLNSSASVTSIGSTYGNYNPPKEYSANMGNPCGFKF